MRWHRRTSPQRGMSLIELTVVLALSAIFLVSALTLMTASARSLSLARTFGGSVTDEAVAARVLQWDLSMAGYGIPPFLYTDLLPIRLVDNPTPRTDSLIVRGVNLGVEPNIGKWSIVLEGNPLGGSSLIILRWNHPFRDFRAQDNVLLTTAVGGRVTGVSFEPASITATNPIVWIDPRTGQSWDALEISLDRPVNAITGTVVYGADSILTAVYTLDEANNRLLRNGSPFMDGVYAFQAQVWVDENDNGRVDAGEWWDAVSAPSDVKKVRAVRVFILVFKGQVRRSSSPVPSTLSVGNTTVSLPPSSRQKFVDLLEVQVAPKNL